MARRGEAVVPVPGTAGATLEAPTAALTWVTGSYSRAGGPRRAGSCGRFSLTFFSHDVPGRDRKQPDATAPARGERAGQGGHGRTRPDPPDAGMLFVANIPPGVTPGQRAAASPPGAVSVTKISRGRGRTGPDSCHTPRKIPSSAAAARPADSGRGLGVDRHGHLLGVARGRPARSIGASPASASSDAAVPRSPCRVITRQPRRAGQPGQDRLVTSRSGTSGTRSGRRTRARAARSRPARRRPPARRGRPAAPAPGTRGWPPSGPGGSWWPGGPRPARRSAPRSTTRPPTWVRLRRIRISPCSKPGSG